MATKRYVYHVFNNAALMKSFTSESESFDYLKTQAQHHRTAAFRVEKAVTIFDSATSPEDKKILDGIRSITRDNCIHASIHMSDADIGRDEDK
jgi:hypothetical protein